MTELISFMKCTFCINEATGEIKLEVSVPICEQCVDNPPALLTEVLNQSKEQSEG